MDKDKRDYLKLSSLLFAIVLIFKLIIKSKTLFLFIAFIEGIFKVCLDTITTRNTYVYSKNYDQVNYVSFIEFINNTSRVIFLLIFYLFDLSLVTIIIIGIIGVIINSFIGYDDGKYGYKKIET